MLQRLPCPICPWQALAQEIEAQSERLTGLETSATHVKVFGWKQDCSLVLSARERLAKVLQHVSERGGALEEARRQAKQVGRGSGVEDLLRSRSLVLAGNRCGAV